MKIKAGAMVLGLFCLLGLSGCQYMRLLQFKGQFQNFSKQFVFIKSQTKPGIRCLTPLLTPDDILLLSRGIAPSVMKVSGGITTWEFVMQKDSPPSDTQRFPLVISLEFNDKNQLARAFYPSQFSSLFDPEFVPQLLKQLGKARFDAASQSLAGDKQTFPEEWIPDRTKIVRHLGEPTAEFVSKNVTLLSYLYTIEGYSGDQKPYITIGIDLLTKKALWFETTVFGPQIGIRLK